MTGAFKLMMYDKGRFFGGGARSKQINKARDTQNLFGLYTGIIIINVLTNERKVCIGLGFTGAMYNCTDILCPRMFDITLAESLVIHKYS